MRAPRFEELDGDDPDAAGGAGDQRGLAVLWFDGFDRVVGGGAGESERAGRGGVETVGNSGGEGRRGCDALTERAVAELGLHDYAEHGVTFGEAVDARPDGLDGAGEVLAEHDREAVLHHPFEAAARDAEVEAVDRAGRDPDEDLAFARLGRGDLDEGDVHRNRWWRWLSCVFLSGASVDPSGRGERAARSE